MAISANYSVPVLVNGYSCDNCTQVAEAKKNINPADPKAGPFGIDAKTDPTTNPNATTAAGVSGVAQTPVVQFGGVLAGSATSNGSNSAQTPWAAIAIGGQVNISA